MGHSVMLNGVEYAGEQIAYNDSTYELVSKVAYLIGVPLRIFQNEHEPPKIEIYDRLEPVSYTHLDVYKRQMKSNYEPLGKHIQLVDYRNSEEVTSTVLGISIAKEFMPSVANVIGSDLSRYKLISKGLFACNPMHVGRDERCLLYTSERSSTMRF